MIEVWASRRNRGEAAALVESLEAEGRLARANNTRYFDRDQLDRGAVKVYHDGTSPVVPWEYGKLDIPCEVIPALRDEAEPETPKAAKAKNAPKATKADDSGDYRVKQSGSWYSLIGPDGKKVGKSKRSEKAAWALRPENGDAGGAD